MGDAVLLVVVTGAVGITALTLYRHPIRWSKDEADARKPR